jgi:hypothetical protein
VRSLGFVELQRPGERFKEEVPDGYRAMANREALKVLIRP